MFKVQGVNFRDEDGGSHFMAQGVRCGSESESESESGSESESERIPESERHCE